MTEAIKTYKYPFERAYLNEVAKEFFRRIPSDDQRTILEVFGWDEKDAGVLRMNGDKVLTELAKLDNRRLAQFMMLCSFAHFGANQYKNHQVSQQQVVKLSKERGVNHTLIDAQVRLELAAKKYKARHQAYLDVVTKGKAAKKPVVYEQPQQQTVGVPDEPKKEADAAPPARGTTRAKTSTQKLQTKTAQRRRKATLKKTAAKADAAKQKAA